MIIPSKPEAILFDWDNTLADTWPTIHDSLHHTFTKMGVTPWTLEEVKQRVHKSLRDSFPEIFGDRWEEAGELYIEYFKQVHLENLTALPLAEEVLSFLKETPTYVAIVSNKTGVNLRKEVEHLGWDKYFHKVIGAKDAKNDKPAIDPIHMALDGSNISPSADVWFVGDSLTDMQCAHHSGCYSILFGDTDPKEESLQETPPKFHLNDHQAFLDVLAKVYA